MLTLGIAKILNVIKEMKSNEFTAETLEKKIDSTNKGEHKKCAFLCRYLL